MADSRYLPLEAAVMLLLIALLGVVLARVQRRRLVAALRRAEAQSRATFNQTAAGYALIGRDGRFKQVNQRLCDMVGYTETEMLGLTISALTHPEDRQASDEARMRLFGAKADTPSSVVERRYLRKDGGTVWALLSPAAVHNERGAVDSVVGIVLDITERRHAQHELEVKTALLSTQLETSRVDRCASGAMQDCRCSASQSISRLGSSTT